MKLPLIAFIPVLFLACDQPVNNVSPDVAAVKFLKDTSTPYEGNPNCTGADSDHDGYVTCLVRRPKTDVAQGEFLSLQCAALESSYGGCDQTTHPYTSGCKLTPMMKQ